MNIKFQENANAKNRFLILFRNVYVDVFIENHDGIKTDLRKLFNKGRRATCQINPEIK